MRHPTCRGTTVALACALAVPHVASGTGAGGPPAAAPAVSARPAAASGSAPADTALVTLASSAGETHAFVAWPRGSGTAPGIVVVHEWWGLNRQIRGVARRLAREGYVAIVPDLYHGRLAADAEDAHALSRALDADAAVADLAAALVWLRAQPRAARTRTGVLGFCMGGGLAQALAVGRPEVAACVVYYGTPEADSARLARLDAPLLGHFGADDRGIAVERVERFRERLREAGRKAEIHVYPGAGHAFANEEREGSYHPDAARVAWARTLAFLQKHLKSDR